VVEPEAWTDPVAGATEIVKSPRMLTTSVTFAECETGPLVPVILSG